MDSGSSSAHPSPGDGDTLDEDLWELVREFREMGISHQIEMYADIVLAQQRYQEYRDGNDPDDLHEPTSTNEYSRSGYQERRLQARRHSVSSENINIDSDSDSIDLQEGRCSRASLSQSPVAPPNLPLQQAAVEQSNTASSSDGREVEDPGSSGDSDVERVTRMRRRERPGGGRPKRRIEQTEPDSPPSIQAQCSLLSQPELDLRARSSSPPQSKAKTMRHSRKSRTHKHRIDSNSRSSQSSIYSYFGKNEPRGGGLDGVRESSSAVPDKQVSESVQSKHHNEDILSVSEARTNLDKIFVPPSHPLPPHPFARWMHTFGSTQTHGHQGSKPLSSISDAGPAWSEAATLLGLMPYQSLDTRKFVARPLPQIQLNEQEQKRESAKSRRRPFHQVTDEDITTQREDAGTLMQHGKESIGSTPGVAAEDSAMPSGQGTTRQVGVAEYPPGIQAQNTFADSGDDHDNMLDYNRDTNSALYEPQVGCTTAAAFRPSNSRHASCYEHGDEAGAASSSVSSRKETDTGSSRARHDILQQRSDRTYTPSENRGNSLELDPVEEIGAWVWDMFVENKFGCGPEKHVEDLAKHLKHVEQAGLAPCANGVSNAMPPPHYQYDLPSVLANPELFSNADVSRDKLQQFWEPRMRSLLYGEVQNPGLPPTHARVCLHTEKRWKSGEPKVDLQGDADSICGFLPTLNRLCIDFKVYAAGPRDKVMSHQLHLSLPEEDQEVDAEDATTDNDLSAVHKQVMIHLGVARLEVGAELEFYAVFPNHSRCGTAPTQLLTEHEYTQWGRDVIIPALNAVYGSRPADAQYRPNSYTALRYQQELPRAAQRVSGENVGPKHKYTISLIKSTDLDSFWSKVVEYSNRIPDFRDIRLFFTGIGFKASYRHLGVIDAWNAALADLDRVLVTDDDDAVWYDLAGDWIISPGQLKDPWTLLHKRCCILSELRKRFGENIGQAQHELFSVGLLHDVANATVYPKKNTKYHRAGLARIVLYSSYKNNMESFHQYPFSQPSKDRQENENPMFVLADDPASVRGARSSAHVTVPGSDAWNFFTTSCKAMEAAVGPKAEPRASGTRIELRGRSRLIRGLLEYLNERRSQQVPLGSESSTRSVLPDWLQPILTRRFNRLLWHNTNRWVLMYLLAATYWHNEVTPEGRKAMTCALQMIEYTGAAPNLSRRPHVWKRHWVPRSMPDAMLRGLGVGDNMEQRGYAFVDRVFNIPGCCFKREVSTVIGFVSRAALNDIRRQCRIGALSMGASDRMASMCYWLRRYRKHRAAADWIMNVMALLCVDRLRLDFINKVVCQHRLELHPQNRDSFLPRKACGRTLFQIEGRAPALKYHHNTERKTFTAIMEILWGGDPELEDKQRKHWNGLEFRRLYARALQAAGEHFGTKGQLLVQAQVRRYCARHIWVYPYPDNDGHFLKGQKHLGPHNPYVYWSLRQGVGRPSDQRFRCDAAPGESVYWGRGILEDGEPPDIPHVHESRETLEFHLRDIAPEVDQESAESPVYEQSN